MKNKNERYFVLQHQTLAYWRDEADHARSRSRGSMRLDTAHLVERGAFGFDVVSHDGTTWQLEAGNPREAERWKTALRLGASCAGNRHVRTVLHLTHIFARPAMRPMWVPDGEAPRCTICANNFSAMNRRVRAACGQLHQYATHACLRSSSTTAASAAMPYAARVRAVSRASQSTYTQTRYACVTLVVPGRQAPAAQANAKPRRKHGLIRTRKSGAHVLHLMTAKPAAVSSLRRSGESVKLAGRAEHQPYETSIAGNNAPDRVSECLQLAGCPHVLVSFDFPKSIPAPGRVL